MLQLRRIGNVLIGVLMVLLAILMAAEPKGTYQFLIVILCVSLLFSGIRELWYYITMAHHMVGGRSSLYRSILVIDMGLFTLSLANVPLFYVMVYLAGIHLFSGAIGILRALEAKSLQAESWKLQLVQGLVNVVLAALCLIFIKSIAIAVTIYAIGLAYDGVMRIVQAMRSTAIVYIQ